MGTKNLSEILSEREEIGNTMHHSLEIATDPWGVHVDRVRLYSSLLVTSIVPGGDKGREAAPTNAEVYGC